MKSTAMDPEARLMATFREGEAPGRGALNCSLPGGHCRGARPETDAGAPTAQGAAEAPESIPVALRGAAGRGRQ
jgi:hypothetical protein